MLPEVHGVFGSSIRIPHEATTISVRTESDGGVRITYPRWGRLAAGLLTLFAGAGFWLWQLSADALHEPLEYALGILLLSPGLWGIGRALRPRPILRVSEHDLVVYHGPAFLERAVARLPIDTLEVQTLCQDELLVRYDSRGLSRRLLAAFVPVGGSRLPKTEAALYTLQVRNSGQEEWLSLLGSPVASEVENARLAIAAVLTMRGNGAAVEAEPDESPEGVNPSHGNP